MILSIVILPIAPWATFKRQQDNAHVAHAPQNTIQGALVGHPTAQYGLAVGLVLNR